MTQVGSEEAIYFDGDIAGKSPDTERNWIVNYVFMLFTFMMQVAILFYHMIHWDSISNLQKILWIITFFALQVCVGYQLEIDLIKITIPWVIFEIVVMWSMMKSKIDAIKQDHCIILLAEINCYIWMVYGHDLLISIIIPLLCEFMIATANTKFTVFQLRSGITYCISKGCARAYIPKIMRWSPSLFITYTLIPLGMCMACQKYQLLVKYSNPFWFVHTAFHVCFWLFVIYS